MDADDDLVLALRGPVRKPAVVLPNALVHVHVEASSLAIYDRLSGPIR